jgi:DNA replication terminus site-binding protein
MELNLKICATFNLLQDHIDLLINEIKESEIVYCKFYNLPETKSIDDKIAPTSIDVKKKQGEEALQQCCNAFKDIFKKNTISGKVLTRFPGIIALNSNEPEAITARISKINNLKDEFKAYILQMPNNDARFELVHKLIPNLITLAAYRHIHYESNSPYSIRFTWMNKHSIKLLSKQEALNMLDNSEIYGQSNAINSQKWSEIVKKEKINIASLAEDEKLRIRRPTRVSPQINVRYSAKDRYHVSAALPFIVINPESDLIFGELNRYEKNEDDPRKKEYEYLVQRLYLQKN